MTDRELDALVAEKVMGWTVLGPRHMAYGFPPNDKAWDDVPAYSSNGDGMLAVIEKMREQGFIHYQSFGFHGGGHRASFEGADRMSFGMVSSDSLPKAVSLAALKALGVEV